MIRKLPINYHNIDYSLPKLKLSCLLLHTIHLMYSLLLPFIVTGAGLNYFEFKIISSGKDCAIGIGMGADNYPLDDMPGWDYNSIGYHADDGKLFCESGAGTEFGPTCTDGDRMGCGVDFRDEDNSSDWVKVFFTKNSQQVGDAIRIKIPAGGLYPLIGMCSEGERVQYMGHWHFLPPTPTGIKTLL